MKTLLRSTIVAAPTDNPDAHLENFRKLDASNLEFQEPEDVAIWQFVRSFVQQHHHVPDVATLQAYFSRTNALSTEDRVQVLRGVPPRSKGDFLLHLDQKAEDRRKVLVSKLLQEASEIVTRGILVDGDKKGEKVLLQGPVAAVRHLLEGSHAIVTPTTGARLSGDVIHDGADFLAHYDRVKSDPLSGVGQFMGIRQIDDTLGGAKRFELWTHAAFTGGWKSSLMLNWAYTQAVYYHHSVLIFSLEMPYQQCRNILYAMHSAHEKFERIHPPLEYQKVKEGLLGPKEEWFLREHVVPDLNQNPDYGSIMIEVADPEKVDFTVADIRSRAETLYAKTPFRLLFIDHALLVSPRKWVASTTERLNEVIRDCKKLAMSFNKGAGMAVVILFQISREGYKAALKARGLDQSPNADRKGGKPKNVSNYVYNLSHLSYANECVVSGTLCPTARGMIPVEEVMVGDLVWSRAGLKSVLATFDQGSRPTWEVVTDQGSRFEATADHRIRVIEGGEVAWAEVGSLRKGDWVIGSGEALLWPSAYPALPPSSWSEQLTDDMAYVLGAWHGDGCARKYGVAFTGNRKEVAVKARIGRSFEAAFRRKLSQYHFNSRPGSFDLECYGKAFRDWFSSVAGERHGCVVPPVILRAPRSCVVAFLQGLFDTDGWVNSQGVVGIKMRSGSFLEQVQTLLRMVGIDAGLRRANTRLACTEKTYEGWTLHLLGSASKVQFAQEIGFTEPWKRERLEAAATHVSKRKPSGQMYPVGDVFLALCEKHTPHNLVSTGRLRRSHYNSQLKARKTGLVSRGAIQYLFAYLDGEGIIDPMADALHELLLLRVMRVASVGPTGRTEPVYDIEVGGDHEYASGPLLSHNCERSSDIVTASWLDDELAKDGKLLLQCLKSRDQKPFEPCMASIYWPCRRIRTLEDPNMQDVTSVASDLDDLG